MDDAGDELPCMGCGSNTVERSACPLCGAVFCQRCAEAPYEFCCDPEPLRPDLGGEG